MTDQAFEDLAHALRVLLEARKGADALFKLDFEEAAGNIDSSLSGVLNSFHSLYDAMAKDGIGSRIDWYGNPPLCAILALRNARHHNQCKKIRTLFRHHLDNINPPQLRHRYLMVDFKLKEEDATTFDVPLSLGDFTDLLSLPTKQTRLRPGTQLILDTYFGLSQCGAHAAAKGLVRNDVFFNVVPLFLNGGIAVHPHIKDRIVHKSTESRHFDFHFREVPPAQMDKHRYTTFDFWKP